MRECVCLCSYRRCRQSDLLFPNRIWSRYIYVYNMYIFTAVVENKKRYGSKSAFGQKTFGEVQTNIYIHLCVRKKIYTIIKNKKNNEELRSE